MIEVIPAVLPKSFEELERELARLRRQAGISKLVQIDLVGTNVLSGRESLPFWQEFDFECDIMLPNADAEVQTCVGIGAARVVVHDFGALQALQPYRQGGYPVEAGFALAAHDAPEALDVCDGLYDFVQVMGIDNIGKQGEPFEPAAVGLVRSLREKFPNAVIQVDGHAAGHEKELVAAGANRLVIGSAIVNAENPREAYKEIYNRANVALR